jgi:ribosomal protein S18 acetylase RimI-like enzyme
MVAMVGTQVVGVAGGQVMLHPDKPSAFFVAEVGVCDEFQREEIATKLCEALMQIAKDPGCEVIWVATEGDNGPARPLYRSLGARETKDIGVYAWNDHAMDG